MIFNLQAVGTRACYLFCRLVRAVRSSLQPLLTELLTVLQPMLNEIATTPMPEPPSATKSLPGMYSAGLSQSLIKLGWCLAILSECNLLASLFACTKTEMYFSLPSD